MRERSTGPACRLRCAVYTRKSSDEGLDQEFNSLHAQREACEAYIASQAGEGWRLIRTRYDDGAYSGGNMQRPALQQLLSDIEAGCIDTVVVYKVDRLTRSLNDFARIVEVFDRRGVSFVSVTQAFNTTTSMGRLTLNMLLSFAQFEREVTGERIRDKIAASKKKGMWMGGYVPLGYDSRDRSLVVHEAEAETVRTIFRLYLDYGNVRSVKAAADRMGLRTKRRAGRAGRMLGGRPMSRGHIYKLLGNPIYAGRIAHKDSVYEGRHPAIIDLEEWEAVQTTLASNAHRRRLGANAKEPSLLAGLLFDDRGNRLSPSHAVKNSTRYRYYVSRNLITQAGAGDADGRRLPASEIEGLVLRALIDFLNDRARVFELLELEQAAPAQTEQALPRARQLAKSLLSGDQETAALVRHLIQRVTVMDKEVQLAVSIDSLREAVGRPIGTADQARSIQGSGTTILRIPAALLSRGSAGKLILVADEGNDRRMPDPALVNSIRRAHDWFGRIASGQANGPAEIAATDGVTHSFVTRVLRLAFLAPDIVETILDGRQPARLTLDRLIRSSRLPLAWEDQRTRLGFK